MLTANQRIAILSARLEKLKANGNPEMTIPERVEAIRETEAALQFAVEEQAASDALR